MNKTIKVIGVAMLVALFLGWTLPALAGEGHAHSRSRGKARIPTYGNLPTYNESTGQFEDRQVRNFPFPVGMSWVYADETPIYGGEYPEIPAHLRERFARGIADAVGLWSNIPGIDVKFTFDYNVAIRDRFRASGDYRFLFVLTKSDQYGTRGCWDAGGGFGYDGKYEITESAVWLPKKWVEQNSPLLSHAIAHNMGHGFGLNHGLMKGQSLMAEPDYESPYSSANPKYGEMSSDDKGSLAKVYEDLSAGFRQSHITIRGEVSLNGQPLRHALVAVLYLHEGASTEFQEAASLDIDTWLFGSSVSGRRVPWTKKSGQRTYAALVGSAVSGYYHTTGSRFEIVGIPPLRNPESKYLVVVLPTTSIGFPVRLMDHIVVAPNWTKEALASNFEAGITVFMGKDPKNRAGTVVDMKLQALPVTQRRVSALDSTPLPLHLSGTGAPYSYHWVRISRTSGEIIHDSNWREGTIDRLYQINGLEPGSYRLNVWTIMWNWGKWGWDWSFRQEDL